MNKVETFVFEYEVWKVTVDQETGKVVEIKVANISINTDESRKAETFDDKNFVIYEEEQEKLQEKYKALKNSVYGKSYLDYRKKKFELDKKEAEIEFKRINKSKNIEVPIDFLEDLMNSAYGTAMEYDDGANCLLISMMKEKLGLE